MDLKTFSKFYDFSGQRVVAITGGAGVLCASMAAVRPFSHAGAKVAILDINQDLAGKLVDKITAFPVEKRLRSPAMYLKNSVLNDSPNGDRN